MTRSCGDCQACCVVLPIIELNKPRNVKCRHCAETGCAIYDNGRPRVCKEWNCEYMEGNLPEYWHPSKTGIMFDVCPFVGVDSVGKIHKDLEHLILRVYCLTATAIADNESRLDAVLLRIVQRGRGRIKEVLYVPYGFKGSGPLGGQYVTRKDDKGRVWEAGGVTFALVHTDKAGKQRTEHISIAV